MQNTNRHGLQCQRALGLSVFGLLLIVSTKLTLVFGVISPSTWLEYDFYPTTARGNLEDHRELESSLTQEELNFCIESLENVAVDGSVGRDDYLLFLEEYSSSSLTFGEFTDLPVPLILVFYTAACSSGRDCVNQEPAVSLDHVGASPGLLIVLCRSIKDMAVLQIDYHFQYQMKYHGAQATDFFYDGIDGINAGELERAVESLLLENLTCERNIRRSLETSRIIKDPTTEVESNRRLRQGMTANHCEYTVQATVLDIFEFTCLPFLDNDIEEGLQCALVSAKVVVTTASLTFKPTPERLQAEIAENLRRAFTKNHILAYLGL